jgi:cell division protein FtsB
VNDWKYQAAESSQHVPWALAMMHVVKEKLFGFIDPRAPLTWLVTNFIVLVAVAAVSVYRIDQVEKREEARDARIKLLEANRVTDAANVRELQAESRMMLDQQKINTGLILENRVRIATHETEDMKHENDDLRHQIDQLKDALRDKRK